MGEDRLARVAPDLSTRLRNASPSLRRRVALAACVYALARTHLEHPGLERALDGVVDIGFDSSQLRAELNKLVEALDGQSFDLQDAAEEGRAGPVEYAAAFSRARAANAVFFALDKDSFMAAAEAVYEAVAATNDLDGLRASTVAVLEREISPGWPEGSFERVVGGWVGEPLERPPQGEFEEREPFD